MIYWASIWEFLNIDKVIFDNALTTVIYAIFIYFALKNGVDWVLFIIIYLIISTVLTLLNISSYLNLIDIIINLIEAIVGQLIPDGEDIWGTIWSWINPFD